MFTLENIAGRLIAMKIFFKYKQFYFEIFVLQNSKYVFHMHLLHLKMNLINIYVKLVFEMGDNVPDYFWILKLLLESLNKKILDFTSINGTYTGKIRCHQKCGWVR